MLREEARMIPVFHEADICVLGGSCTGVFAAVRAARLGAKVVLVEKQSCGFADVDPSVLRQTLKEGGSIIS